MREGHYTMAVEWSNISKDVPVDGVPIWCWVEKAQALCPEGWDRGMWLSGTLKHPAELKL